MLMLTCYLFHRLSTVVKVWSFELEVSNPNSHRITFVADFAANATFDTLRASSCTSCLVTQVQLFSDILSPSEHTDLTLLTSRRMILIIVRILTKWVIARNPTDQSVL